MDSANMYVLQAFQLLLSPMGIVLVLAFLAMAFVVSIVPAARWPIVAVLLWTSTFGIGTEVGDLVPDYARLYGPLHFMSLYARHASLACALLLLLPTMMTSKGWRTHVVVAGAIAFCALHLWMATRLIFGGATAARFFSNGMAAVLELTVLGIGLGRWMQSPRGANALLKAVAGFAALFACGNILQLIGNPASIRMSRYTGTTTNAQYVAQITAMVFPTLIVLFMGKRMRAFWRLPMIALAAATIIFMIWTGSRIALVMTFVGMSLLFRWRLHRFVVPAVVVGIMVWVGSLILPESFANIERFMDTYNTRSEPWADMTNKFLNNVLIGTPSSGHGYGESTYLGILAYYGIIGGLFGLTAVGLIFGAVIQVERKKSYLGSDQILVNLATCNLGMIFVSGIFEASLLGPLNTLTMLLYVNLAFLAYLVDATAAAAASNSVLDDPFMLSADQQNDPEGHPAPA